MSLPYPNRSLSEIAGHPRRDDSMELELQPIPDTLSEFPEFKMPKLRRGIVMSILLMGMGLSVIDTSIVSTALLSIANDLDDFGNSPWAVLAYLITYMGFAVGWAKLSDIFGRCAIVWMSWLLFVGFSAGCALAQTMTQVIVFRAFQGIGGSGLYALCQICLVEISSSSPSFIGSLMGMTLAVSFVAGPLLGGIISNFWGWRWIFWMNLPFGLGCLVVLPFLWPKQPITGTFWAAIKRMDWLGNFLLITASILLIVGLQEGGSFTRDWNDKLVTTSLIIAALSWIGFWVWEFMLDKKAIGKLANVETVFPVAIAKNRIYLTALLQTLCTGFTYIALAIFLPELFQIVDGDNPLWAGIKLLPMLGATSLGSFLAGFFSKRSNKTSPTLLAAAGLQLAGLALFCSLGPVQRVSHRSGLPLNSTSTSHSADVASGFALSHLTQTVEAMTTPAEQYFYQFLFGFGVGLSLAASSLITSIQTQRGDHASAHGAMAQARMFGGALGVITCNIIINSTLSKEILPYLGSERAASFMRSPVSMMADGLRDEEREWVRVVYLGAFQRIARGFLYVGVVGLVVALCAWDRNPLPMDLFARHCKMEGMGTGSSDGSGGVGSRFGDDQGEGRHGERRGADDGLQEGGFDDRTQEHYAPGVEGRLQQLRRDLNVPTIATSIPGGSIRLDDLGMRSGRTSTTPTGRHGAFGGKSRAGSKVAVVGVEVVEPEGGGGGGGRKQYGRDEGDLEGVPRTSTAERL